VLTTAAPQSPRLLEEGTMKPKTMMLMVVAVGCGLVASYMTSRLLAERNAQPQTEAKVTVVVAKQRVAAMVLIKEPDKYFELRDFPESVAPKKSLKSLDDVKDQRLNKHVAEDSPVTSDDILNKEQIGLAGSLPAGTRAVAIKVNAESLVGGFVLPGTRVDVVSTTRGGAAEAQSQIILQDMLVLAVDTTSGRDPSTQTILGNTVTLAAKPEEATKLSLAQSLGDLKLTLRGLGDNQQVRAKAAKVGDLSHTSHSGGSDAEDDNQVALAPPPVPKILPEPPPPPKVEEKKEEPKEDPVKTHTMTIISGEYTQRAVFVLDPVEGWKNGNVDATSTPPNKPGRNR
jgi:pilus assembly protein CpaB